jgi:chemotaxis protein MotB
MALTDVTEEGEGEGYFASVSDLMVGILFVFLLMLTVFALNFRDAEYDQRKAEDQAKTEAALAATQRTENDRLRQLLKAAVAQLEHDIADRAEARNRLLDSLEQSLMNRGVNVIIDRASGILRLSEDLLFNLGESTIQKEKLPTLQTLAEVFAQVLPCYAYGGNRTNCPPDTSSILETVLVEGHTDRQGYMHRRIAPATGQAAGGLVDRPGFVPLSPAESQAQNDRLSTERALNVFKELRQAQPSLINLLNAEQVPLLGVSGYGERRPLPDAQGNSARDFQKNRRIDVRFVLSARTSDEITHLRDQIRQTLEGAH